MKIMKIYANNEKHFILENFQWEESFVTLILLQSRAHVQNYLSIIMTHVFRDLW